MKRNRNLIKGLEYRGPSLSRDAKLLQGNEQGGFLSGALSDVFKGGEGESNFTVDMQITNETLLKMAALVALAVILSKKL